MNVSKTHSEANVPKAHSAATGTASVIPPRGLRNNNPGNIRHGTAPWRGEIPGDDPDFISFDTMTDGIRAMARLVRNYQTLHRLDTVAAIVGRWAPPNENDTAGYIAYVAESVGVAPDAGLDLSHAAVLGRLVYAVICRENGQEAAARWVSAADLLAGVRDACGEPA